jgi:DNA polymerase-3 subunit alpha
LKRNIFEDAFDEIEILNFPVSCTPFDLLQTKYSGPGDEVKRSLIFLGKQQLLLICFNIGITIKSENCGSEKYWYANENL